MSRALFPKPTHQVPRRRTGRSRTLLATIALTALLLGPLAGRQALAQGSVSLLRDAEIEKILRDYTDPISKAAGLAPEDVSLYLVGDKEINAGVAGGQNIFLNTGLIVRTKTPGELQGVIAHEVGHIGSAHLARRDEAAAGALATRLITYGFGVLAAMATPDPRAVAGLIYSADYFAALQLAGYTRIQEGAADQAAAKYLESAGLSGKGLVSFFDNFRSTEVFSEARKFSYFRSHPLSSERIESLKTRVAQASNYAVVDSPESMTRHEIMIAKIRGFMNYPQQTFQDYPDSDTSFPARYARAIAHYKNNDLGRSMTETDALISDYPDNPYLHELKGQFLFESGKVSEAEEPYRRSVELAPNEPLLRTAYAQTLMAIKRPGVVDEAMVQLERALLSDGENPMAWRLLSEAYEIKGEAGMARLAVAEQNFALGRLMEARQMGIRARELLPQGTPQYRRAVDIVHAAETNLVRRRRS